MNLGKARIAYPYVLYNVQVSHHTERRSTAMEWLLLEIAHIAEKYQEYISIPLDSILKNMFSIADGDLLLRQVLNNLIDVNALKQIVQFSDRSDWQQIRCGDLKLTENGRRLQKENKLPAKAQNNNLEVIYDVINGQVRIDNQKNKSLSDNTTNPKAKDISLDNLPGFPDSLVNERIQNLQQTGKNLPNWLQGNSHIDNIRPLGTPQIKWYNTSRDILADDEGNISLRDETNTDVVEAVLRETDLGTMPDYEIPIIGINDLLEKRKVQPYASIKDRIDVSLRKQDICFVSPQFKNIIEQQNKKNCIILGQLDFGIDDNGGNFVVHIPYPPYGGMCYQDKECVISAAAVALHVGNITRQVPYIFETVDEDFDSRIRMIVKDYYLRDERILKLLAYIDNPQYHIFYSEEYICRKLNSTSIEIFTPVDKTLDRLLKLNKKMTDALPNLPIPASCETIRLELIEKKNTDILNDIREWVIQWREALEKLQKDTNVNVNDIDWQGTSFGSSIERMEQISDAIALFFDDTSSRYNKIYVMDTSALMHYPAVLDDFTNNRAMVIVPKPVLVELDNLKESDDEKVQKEARRAINKIDEYRENQWLNLKEDNYEELLPESYRKSIKNDFLILSVALRYFVKKPVMVTDDNNFKNIATSQDIEAITAHELHEKLSDSKTKVKNKKKKK